MVSAGHDGGTAQSSTLIRLVPFETRQELSAFSCTVRLRCAAPRLLLHYAVKGPLRQLIIPAAAEMPGHTAGLWRTTCLECFVRESNSALYTEWNFSPSGNWWACEFDRYREAARRQPGGLRPAQIQVRKNEGCFVVQAALVPAPGRLYIDPAVILAHADGRFSHWAAAHPCDHPDFHRPSGRGVAIQAQGRNAAKALA
jgi:hypothetical protein